MDKRKTIKIIADSIIIEEMAIPIYKKHYDSTMFWSGFEEPDQKIIRDVLDTLISESRRHIVILNSLSKLVEGE